MSWTPRVFTGIDNMLKNVNIPPLPNQCDVVFNTMSCCFCHKKQGVLSKSQRFKMLIPGDVVFDTMCKWFPNMDIIDKTALIKGYKIVMIWQDVKIYMMWLKNGSR